MASVGRQLTELRALRTIVDDLDSDDELRSRFARVSSVLAELRREIGIRIERIGHAIAAQNARIRT